MTTNYIFKAVFTSLGLGYVPSPEPTITVVDLDDALLVSGQAVTFLDNMPGVCVYVYSGSDGLNLQARFSTSDLLADQRELFCDAALYTRAAPADVHVYASLAISAAQAAQVVDGQLLITAGYTFRQTFDSDSMDDLSAARLIVAMKENVQTLDAASIFYVDSASGLLTLNGVTPYAHPEWGALSVTGSAGAWHIDLVLDEGATENFFAINDVPKVGALKYILNGDALPVMDLTGYFTPGRIRKIT